MDEELAVYLDLGDWFDFTKADLFDRGTAKTPGPNRADFPDPTLRTGYGRHQTARQLSGSVGGCGQRLSKQMCLPAGTRRRKYLPGMQPG